MINCSHFQKRLHLNSGSLTGGLLHCRSTSVQGIQHGVSNHTQSNVAGAVTEREAAISTIFAIRARQGQRVRATTQLELVATIDAGDRMQCAVPMHPVTGQMWHVMMGHAHICTL